MLKVDLVRKIHATDSKIVLAIAGGGSEVIGELLRHGQGSNTILDAVVPYCQRAYEEFIGGPPDKFVSEDAAAQLAMAAWQRAIHLQDPRLHLQELIGIGVTCALAKESERAGREHRVWVARQHHDKCITLGFNVNANREEEEAIVADCILNEVAMGSGILEDIPSIKGVYQVTGHKYLVPAHVGNVYNGSMPASSIAGDFDIGDTRKLIFPGSFNPFHDGHILMAKIAREVCPPLWRGEDDKVHFEISVRNVDKPLLTYKAVVGRSENWLAVKTASPHAEHLGELWYTNAPMFVDKSKIFPGCVFVVGYDTFARINNCKYYKSQNELESRLSFLQTQGVKWIVFPRRKSDGSISTEQDVLDLCWSVGSRLRESVFIVPNDKYPEEIHNISSSEIRKNQHD